MTASRGSSSRRVKARDEDLRDWHTVQYGIDELAKPHDKPLFLAVGLNKPHMPWNVPQKYYDLHPLDKIVLPPTLANDLDDVPPAGVSMAKPQGDHEAILKSGRWKDAVQGYLATISYSDAMIGRLIDALRQIRRIATTPSSSSGATTAGTWARRSTGANSRSGRRPPARPLSGSCPA